MGDQEKLIQFVTWLGENIPELKGKAPEEIVETVNKLSSSEEGQQMLQGLIKEFESNTTGMFKKGGKLNYLICLKTGGNIRDCGCKQKINKAQDGIVLGLHPTRSESSRPVQDFYSQRNVDGNVMTEFSAFSNGDPDDILGGSITQVVDPKGNVSYYSNHNNANGTELRSHKMRNGIGKRYFDRSRKAVLLHANAPAVIDKYRPVGNEAPMPNMQDGGRVLGSDQHQYSRREAINAGRSMGLTRQQSRNAYNNMMYQTMKDGISAKDARRITRNNMIQSAGQSARRNLENATTQSTPQLNKVDLTSLNDNYQIKDVAPNVDDYNIDVPEIETSIPTPDRFGGSFDNAFGLGRKLGLSKFYYNGPDKKAGWYNTNLAPEEKTPGWKQAAQAAQSANQNVVNHAENSANNAKTGLGRFVKSINAGMVRSQLDSPTLGLQEGGTIVPQETLLVNLEQYPYATKRDAIDAAEQLGFAGANARRAYGDAKDFVKKQGLRGKDMRQAARYLLIDKAYPRAGVNPNENVYNILDNFTTKISYD